MGSPRSVRLGDGALAELTEYAKVRGMSASAAIERLVDEGLRRDRHPDITFRDGPAGRRAGLVDGPDVWEVAAAIRAVRRGLGQPTASEVVDAVATATGLPPVRVRSAVRYYAEHPDEIDERVDANERAADELERRWHRERDILGHQSR